MNLKDMLSNIDRLVDKNFSCIGYIDMLIHIWDRLIGIFNSGR
jgi:hypothetical protein